MAKERHRTIEEYPLIFRTFRAPRDESRIHVGTVILSHIAQAHAAEHGNTPTLFQDRNDSHGLQYKRQVYANRDGRSALHVVDDYGDSMVKMTHVGGSKGIVTFISGTGLDEYGDLIVHPNDPPHVRLQIARIMDRVSGPHLNQLLERVDPLHAPNQLFPHSYSKWYSKAFVAPLRELRSFVQQDAAQAFPSEACE